MPETHPPSVSDFRHFFRLKLLALRPAQELIWLSATVPVNALAAAYPLGIFPWPGDDPDFFPWVCPKVRGVLCFDQFHLGKSSCRQIRNQGFDLTYDRAFSQVIQACHHAHAPESWIHPLMQQAYTDAHHQGFAHSVEVWQQGELVGGLYGIDSGHFFSGESMFHKIPNAGKAAIQFLVSRLQQRGDTFLDIQQLTPHMQAMGAQVWSRSRFLMEIGSPA